MYGPHSTNAREAVQRPLLGAAICAGPQHKGHLIWRFSLWNHPPFNWSLACQAVSLAAAATPVGILQLERNTISYQVSGYGYIILLLSDNSCQLPFLRFKLAEVLNLFDLLLGPKLASILAGPNTISDLQLHFPPQSDVLQTLLEDDADLDDADIEAPPDPSTLMVLLSVRIAAVAAAPPTIPGSPEKIILPCATAAAFQALNCWPFPRISSQQLDLTATSVQLANSSAVLFSDVTPRDSIAWTGRTSASHIPSQNIDLGHVLSLVSVADMVLPSDSQLWALVLAELRALGAGHDLGAATTGINPAGTGTATSGVGIRPIDGPSTTTTTSNRRQLCSIDLSALRPGLTISAVVLHLGSSAVRPAAPVPVRRASTPQYDRGSHTGIATANAVGKAERRCCRTALVVVYILPEDQQADVFQSRTGAKAAGAGRGLGGADANNVRQSSFRGLTYSVVSGRGAVPSEALPALESAADAFEVAFPSSVAAVWREAQKWVMGAATEDQEQVSTATASQAVHPPSTSSSSPQSTPRSRTTMHPQPGDGCRVSDSMAPTPAGYAHAASPAAAASGGGGAAERPSGTTARGGRLLGTRAAPPDWMLGHLDTSDEDSMDSSMPERASPRNVTTGYSRSEPGVGVTTTGGGGGGGSGSSTSGGRYQVHGNGGSSSSSSGEGRAGGGESEGAEGVVHGQRSVGGGRKGSHHHHHRPSVSTDGVGKAGGAAAPPHQQQQQPTTSAVPSSVRRLSPVPVAPPASRKSVPLLSLTQPLAGSPPSGRSTSGVNVGVPYVSPSTLSVPVDAVLGTTGPAAAGGELPTVKDSTSGGPAVARAPKVPPAPPLLLSDAFSSAPAASDECASPSLLHFSSIARSSGASSSVALSGAAAAAAAGGRGPVSSPTHPASPLAIPAAPGIFSDTKGDEKASTGSPLSPSSSNRSQSSQEKDHPQTQSQQPQLWLQAEPTMAAHLSDMVKDAGPDARRETRRSGFLGGSVAGSSSSTDGSSGGGGTGGRGRFSPGYPGIAEGPAENPQDTRGGKICAGGNASHAPSPTATAVLAKGVATPGMPLGASQPAPPPTAISATAGLEPSPVRKPYTEPKQQSESQRPLTEQQHGPQHYTETVSGMHDTTRNRAQTQPRPSQQQHQQQRRGQGALGMRGSASSPLLHWTLAKQQQQQLLMQLQAQQQAQQQQQEEASRALNPAQSASVPSSSLPQAQAPPGIQIHQASGRPVETGGRNVSVGHPGAAASNQKPLTVSAQPFRAITEALGERERGEGGRPATGYPPQQPPVVLQILERQGRGEGQGPPAGPSGTVASLRRSGVAARKRLFGEGGGGATAAAQTAGGGMGVGVRSSGVDAEGGMEGGGMRSLREGAAERRTVGEERGRASRRYDNTYGSSQAPLTSSRSPSASPSESWSEGAWVSSIALEDARRRTRSRDGVRRQHSLYDNHRHCCDEHHHNNDYYERPQRRARLDERFEASSEKDDDEEGKEHQSDDDVSFDGSMHPMLPMWPPFPVPYMLPYPPVMPYGYRRHGGGRGRRGSMPTAVPTFGPWPWPFNPPSHHATSSYPTYNSLYSTAPSRHTAVGRSSRAARATRAAPTANGGKATDDAVRQSTADPMRQRRRRQLGLASSQLGGVPAEGPAGAFSPGGRGRAYGDEGKGRMLVAPQRLSGHGGGGTATIEPNAAAVAVSRTLNAVKVAAAALHDVRLSALAGPWAGQAVDPQATTAPPPLPYTDLDLPPEELTLHTTIPMSVYNMNLKDAVHVAVESLRARRSRDRLRMSPWASSQSSTDAAAVLVPLPPPLPQSLSAPAALASSTLLPMQPSATTPALPPHPPLLRRQESALLLATQTAPLQPPLLPPSLPPSAPQRLQTQPQAGPLPAPQSRPQSPTLATPRQGSPHSGGSRLSRQRSKPNSPAAPPRAVSDVGHSASGGLSGGGGATAQTHTSPARRYPGSPASGGHHAGRGVDTAADAACRTAAAATGEGNMRVQGALLGREGAAAGAMSADLTVMAVTAATAAAAAAAAAVAHTTQSLLALLVPGTATAVQQHAASSGGSGFNAQPLGGGLVRQQYDHQAHYMPYSQSHPGVPLVPYDYAWHQQQQQHPYGQHHQPRHHPLPHHHHYQQEQLLHHQQQPMHYVQRPTEQQQPQHYHHAPTARPRRPLTAVPTETSASSRHADAPPTHAPPERLGVDSAVVGVTGANHHRPTPPRPLVVEAATRIGSCSTTEWLWSADTSKANGGWPRAPVSKSSRYPNNRSENQENQQQQHEGGKPAWKARQQQSQRPLSPGTSAFLWSPMSAKKERPEGRRPGEPGSLNSTSLPPPPSSPTVSSMTTRSRRTAQRSPVGTAASASSYDNTRRWQKHQQELKHLVRAHNGNFVSSQPPPSRPPSSPSSRPPSFSLPPPSQQPHLPQHYQPKPPPPGAVRRPLGGTVVPWLRVMMCTAKAIQVVRRKALAVEARVVEEDLYMASMGADALTANAAAVYGTTGYGTPLTTTSMPPSVRSASISSSPYGMPQRKPNRPATMESTASKTTTAATAAGAEQGSNSPRHDHLPGGNENDPGLTSSAPGVVLPTAIRPWHYNTPKSNATGAVAAAVVVPNPSGTRFTTTERFTALAGVRAGSGYSSSYILQSLAPPSSTSLIPPPQPLLPYYPQEPPAGRQQYGMGTFDRAGGGGGGSAVVIPVDANPLRQSTAMLGFRGLQGSEEGAGPRPAAALQLGREAREVGGEVGRVGDSSSAEGPRLHQKDITTTDTAQEDMMDRWGPFARSKVMAAAAVAAAAGAVGGGTRMSFSPFTAHTRPPPVNKPLSVYRLKPVEPLRRISALPERIKPPPLSTTNPEGDVLPLSPVLHHEPLLGEVQVQVDAMSQGPPEKHQGTIMAPQVGETEPRDNPGVFKTEQRQSGGSGGDIGGNGNGSGGGGIGDGDDGVGKCSDTINCHPQTEAASSYGSTGDAAGRRSSAGMAVGLVGEVSCEEDKEPSSLFAGDVNEQ